MISIEELENRFNSLKKYNLVFASFFFSLMTLCVKNIDKRIPIYELVLFRSLLSLIITLLIINIKNINPWGKNKPLLILRGFLGTLALVCIFYAIRNMPLSISTVIQYTYPIFISIFACIFINEKITRNIIFALLIGWIGILVILNPSQLSNINVEIENVSISIAFLGAICTALAYVTVKKLSFTEDVYVIIEYFPLVSFIALLPIVTISGLTMASLAGGALLFEVTFSWPGIALRLHEAISQRDYNVVQGIVIFTSILIVSLNLFVDILIAYLDPRIEY